MPTVNQDEDHDIVWGLPAIGRVINRDRRGVEYLVKRYPEFPIKQVAGGYVASRRALLDFLLKKEVDA